jgi:SAM-dependent methyltransferase
MRYYSAVAIYKEWIKPIAVPVVRHQVAGPAYMLGDTECYFSPEYATRRLSNAGLLRNANFPIQVRNGLLSARSFFAMLGVQPYFDIDINPNADIQLDFSQELPSHLSGSAQLVIDMGTSEHIFNVAQVFKNIVQLLKVGGVVIHLSPVSWFNHGFYNFNPLLFNEFYTANGFRRLEHHLIWSPLQYPLYMLAKRIGLRYSSSHSRWTTPSLSMNDERYRVDTVFNTAFIFSRVTYLFMAKRVGESEIKYPIQRLYQPNEPIKH